MPTFHKKTTIKRYWPQDDIVLDITLYKVDRFSNRIYDVILESGDWPYENTLFHLCMGGEAGEKFRIGGGKVERGDHDHHRIVHVFPGQPQELLYA
jgi:hypothetical protein